IDALVICVAYRTADKGRHQVRFIFYLPKTAQPARVAVVVVVELIAFAQFVGFKIGIVVTLVAACKTNFVYVARKVKVAGIIAAQQIIHFFVMIAGVAAAIYPKRGGVFFVYLIISRGNETKPAVVV